MTQEQLEKRIKSLTKKIGEARRDHRRDELSNFRAQREAFARQLIEEFSVFYIIKDGSTQFVNEEDMQEHYADPAERMKVRGAGMVQVLFAARQSNRTKLDWAKDASDEELREFIESAYAKELEKNQAAIHTIQEEIGEELMDFDLIDTRQAESDELLKGIDLSSLMDETDDDES